MELGHTERKKRRRHQHIKNCLLARDDLGLILVYFYISVFYVNSSRNEKINVFLVCFYDDLLDNDELLCLHF